MTETMVTPPEAGCVGWLEDENGMDGMYGAVLMSNFDHTVDEKVAERLKADPTAAAEYTAWNFHAACWYKDSQFHAAVSVYGDHQVTLSADTPEELMEACSERFGGE